VGDLVGLCSEQGKFLATALLSPGEKVVARVLSHERIKLDKGWLLSRMATAIDLRRYIYLDGTNAYRLVNAEGDGLPGLSVDRYDEHLMVQLFSECWRPHLSLVTEVLQQILAPVGIYEKKRPQKTRQLEAQDGSKKYSQLLTGQPRAGRFQVQENNLNFLVDLERDLNTGLFFDQRENRHNLMQMIGGRTFLNLFAYTGAFSVAAAAADAKKVTSVDTSGRYLEWARENFSANRLNPKRHEFIVDDCFAALNRFAREKKTFDVILFDPPSFSTTRKSTFSTRGGTAELVAKTAALLTPGGLMVGSTNHQKSELADYLKEFRRGALQAGCELRVVGIHHQPADFPYSVSFPEGRYLKQVSCVKISL
jgi:23S rRNA (cytosine1962-C5)-methyltransferase